MYSKLLLLVLFTWSLRMVIDYIFKCMQPFLIGRLTNMPLRKLQSKGLLTFGSLFFFFYLIASQSTSECKLLQLTSITRHHECNPPQCSATLGRHQCKTVFVEQGSSVKSYSSLASLSAASPIPAHIFLWKTCLFVLTFSSAIYLLLLHHGFFSLFFFVRIL